METNVHCNVTLRCMFYTVTWPDDLAQLECSNTPAQLNSADNYTRVWYLARMPAWDSLQSRKAASKMEMICI